MAINKKINTALLDYAIMSRHETRKAFAIEYNFRPGDVYNWIAGTCAPSDHQRRKLCKALEISEDKLLLMSLGNTFKGLDFALNRWSEEHKNLQRESISDQIAVSTLIALSGIAVQEAEEEGAEAPFFVPGPTETSDTTE